MSPNLHFSVTFHLWFRLCSWNSCFKVILLGGKDAHTNVTYFQKLQMYPLWKFDIFICPFRCNTNSLQLGLWQIRVCSSFHFNSIKVTVAHPNFHPHHSFLVGWLSWLVGHNLMIILLFCRSLKKYWCKTSYLDSLQASQNLMNKFQDGDSSSQLCHTSCTVHLLCCNIGEFCFLFWLQKVF